ncbi:unnamed protein product [Mycena citricolor]|uniref:Aldehyde dehydrogenase domain-containing protein n=1 Tax=Mycena citricolor TaxID=2018698 RepID=A0AAD2Q194_9AGAR|nr:unnamed protein product [Mycena citricolor]
MLEAAAAQSHDSRAGDLCTGAQLTLRCRARHHLIEYDYIYLGFRVVSCALAAGNTCVSKGSGLGPHCPYNIGRSFTNPGLPKGALNVIYNPRDSPAQIMTLLIESPTVKKLNFTGSNTVGSSICAAAGRAVKPRPMKLGGKAAAIVLGDADLAMAASQHVLGAFMKASQMRMGTERVIVQEPIEDQFYGEQGKNSNLLTRCLPSSYRLRTKQLGSPTTANVE